MSPFEGVPCEFLHNIHPFMMPPAKLALRPSFWRSMSSADRSPVTRGRRALGKEAAQLSSWWWRHRVNFSKPVVGSWLLKFTNTSQRLIVWAKSCVNIWTSFRSAISTTRHNQGWTFRRSNFSCLCPMPWKCFPCREVWGREDAGRCPCQHPQVPAGAIFGHRGLSRSVKSNVNYMASGAECGSVRIC